MADGRSRAAAAKAGAKAGGRGRAASAKAGAMAGGRRSALLSVTELRLKNSSQVIIAMSASSLDRLTEASPININ